MIFCVTKNQLQALVENAIRGFLTEEILKFTRDGMSLEEMLKQQIDESGSFAEALETAIKRFTSKTENVEVHLALDLVTLYNFGPKKEIGICFEMKSGFNKKVSTLSDLTTNIKSATHIDCRIRSKKEEWHFQIKRYPSEYLKFTQKAIIEYLEKVFEKYGEMTDTHLILLLQPTLEAATTPLDFKKMHQALVLMGNKISFDQVALIFNANNKKISLVRIFPDFKIAAKPLQFLSEKYQEMQNKWENQMHNQLKKTNPNNY